MSDRSDRVPLPDSETRCEPSKPDRAASRCARRMAAIPVHGAALTDYSIGAIGCCAVCPGYVDVHALRMRAAEPVKRPVRPAIKGM